MSKHQYPFEKLQVWHLAIANSVSGNLSEGSGRFSNKEKARYFEIAYGSLLETASHMYLALKLDFVSSEAHDAIRPHIEELSNKINALYRRLKQ